MDILFKLKKRESILFLNMNNIKYNISIIILLLCGVNHLLQQYNQQCRINDFSDHLLKSPFWILFFHHLRFLTEFCLFLIHSGEYHLLSHEIILKAMLSIIIEYYEN